MILSKNEGNRYLWGGQQICICIARPLHINYFHRTIFASKIDARHVIFIFYFRFLNDNFKF